MTYLLIGLAVLLLGACTLIQVDVSSDDEGQTTIQPSGINVTVADKVKTEDKEKQP